MSERVTALRPALALAAAMVFLSLLGCVPPEPGAEPTPGDPGVPQLQVQLPPAGATLTSPVVLSVSGDGITRVGFEVDGAEEASVANAPFEWTLDPQAFPAGAHQIGVSVDWTEGTDERFVDVFFEQPPTGGTQPSDVYEAVANLAPGTWYEIPDTRLEDLAPDPLPDGSMGVEAVINSWCGGAFDTKRDRLYVWGGGHGNYAGNEVYGFDMNELRWYRLTDPSAVPSSGVLNADGTPMTRHTYDYLAYLPSEDVMVVSGGAAFWQLRNYGAPASEVNRVWFFHPSSNTWTYSGTTEASGVYTSTAVDADGKLWSIQGSSSSGHLWSYAPASGSWTKHSYVQVYDDVNAEIDPVEGVLVFVGNGKARRFWLDERSALDPDDPWKEKAESFSLSGAGPVGSVKAPGLAYHPGSGRLVAWGGGRTVYSLDTSTWQWAAHQSTGSDPGSPTPTGTYARWAWCARKNLFVLATGSGRNICVYRPPSMP